MSFKVSRERSLDNPDKCKPKATASEPLRAAWLEGFAGGRSQECVHCWFRHLQTPTEDPSLLAGVTPRPRGVLNGKLVFFMSDANPVCRRKTLITRAGCVGSV